MKTPSPHETPKRADQKDARLPWEQANRALQKVWGYPAFRDAQRAPLEAILGGRDVLAVLPTGGGKSLLYQVPALLADGLTIVVTPLVALMHDQVAHLKQRHVAAASLDYSLTRRQAEQTLVNAQHGAYRLLYVSPERLETELFLAYADKLSVARLAVDEAHCVSLWGRNFRPAYRRIPEARARLGDPPLVAVTATATPEVRRDMVALLGLHDPAVFVQGFARPNLTFAVQQSERRLPVLREAIRASVGPSIVYAATRRSAESLGAQLQRAGLPTVVYHGGLSAPARSEAQAAWMRGDVATIVATNAFGMGVDKPDVRLVAHAELPGSLEAYYQEAGRAGRDGAPATALLLWSPRDAETQRALVDASHPTRAQAAALFDALLNLAQVAVGELRTDPLPYDAERVAELTGVPVGLVGAGLRLLEGAEVVRLHPGLPGRGWLRVRVTPDQLRAYAEGQGGRLGAFVATLARALPAEAYVEPTPVLLKPLARAAGVSPERLARGLAFLDQHGLVAWRDGALPRVEPLVPRSPRLALDDRLVQEARRAAEAGLRAMEAYVRRPACRPQALLAYFGETAPACGRCDVCQAPPPVLHAADAPALRALLQQIHAGALPDESPRTADLLRYLLAEGLLGARPDDPLAYRVTEAGAAHLSEAAGPD